ncbi:rRNA-processing protein utp21 [Malassezia sp. CBS 17886]|nr:rRNA-processing protein utp21 [Malassezia sp. CBS 17886]
MGDGGARREKRARGPSSARAPAVQAPTNPHVRNALYAPFRALGYVTNDVPFVLQVRFGGKDAQTPDVNVVTSVGDTWAMWSAERMTLLFVGPLLAHPISALAHATSPDSLLVAAGPSVHRYVRGSAVAEYSAAGRHLSSLLVFGDYVAALAADGHALFVWSLASTELLRTLEFRADWTTSAIAHPATYLNKVVVASRAGDLQLWNIRTGALLHEFRAAEIRGAARRGTAAGVVALVQSPAVDVLAVAYADGLVSLFDLSRGDQLFRVRVEGGLAAGCVTFRTDGDAQTLAVATRAGSLVLFDLDAAADPSGGAAAGPRLLHSVRFAHDGPIGSIEFVPGQPILISSGADNALKEWFFESPTLPPRVLKARSGHSLPPHLIRYYGDDGRALLSASHDRSVRCLSVVRDSRSFELSQGAMESRASKLAVEASSLKLPPATSLSYSTTRSRDWDDVLTTHANDRYAHTWTVRDKRMNAAVLSATRSKKLSAVATAACVSACGNFALLGTSHGLVEVYNMQSHLHRRTFDTRAPRDAAGDPVSDIVSDAVNQVCAVSTQHGTIHYFDFHTGEKHGTTVLPAGCAGLRLHRDSDLLVALGDDLVLTVIDLDTRRIVRRFAGFRGRILDAAFSADGRWVVACSTDSVVRTFDLATAQLIDAFRTPSMATSVTFSPTGDFLATAHVDSVGVHLWANRTQFTSVPLRALRMGDMDQVRDAALPTIQGALDEDLPADADAGEPVLQRAYTSPPQLRDGDAPLVTLSTMPRARWMSLLHLDTIQRRNKPKEPPKKPEKAPFFMDAAPPTQERPASEALGARSAAADATAAGALTFQSDLERRLRIAVEAGDVGALFTYLHTLSAPQLDMEIRALETDEQQALFLRALTLRLQTQCDYEAVQAMLAVFLACHSDTFTEQAASDDGSPSALALAVRGMLAEQQRQGERVVDLLDYCLGTLSFLRDVPLSFV